MEHRKTTVNVLYVDEDPAFLELIATIFPKYGEYTVLTAQSPTTALDIIEEKQLDCVIFDYELLDATQLELLKTITEHTTIAPSRTNITHTSTSNDASTVPPPDENAQKENTGAENFPDVIRQIEVLTGKQCVGLQLQSRSKPFPLSTTSTGKPSHNIQQQADNLPEQIHNQQPLLALHEATGELMEAQTKDEILEIVLETADKILPLPVIAVYLWDEQNGELRPHTVTPETETLFDDVPTFSGPDSLAWDTFLEGEFRIYKGLSQHEKRYNPQTAIESELFAPLGDHGLLLSGSTEPDAFSPPGIKAIQMLVANTEIALELQSQGEKLQQRNEQLQIKKDQLATLRRINGVIREIGRAAVISSTRSEIEQTICENLTTIDPYCFAWIGGRDHDDALSPRQWSGMNSDFLDQLCEETGKTSERAPPAEKALQTGELQVVQDIFREKSFASWRKPALDRGLQSVISLPLSHDGTTYGVLEIYASEPSAFAEEEQDVLSELGEMIVHAFTALERKQTLMAGEHTELELRMKGEDDILSRAARQVKTRLELDTVVSRDDGTWLAYITGTDCTPSIILSTIREFTAVESAQQIQTKNDTKLFGIVLTEFPLAELLTTQGAKLGSITATSEKTTLTVSVSNNADVRSVVAACRTKYPNLELVRRNASVDNDVRVDDGSPIKELSPQDQLTDRQHEVLQVAVAQGFFEWPRENTGEEIADHLGISAPTFHRHIRRALQKLLENTLKA